MKTRKKSKRQRAWEKYVRLSKVAKRAAGREVDAYTKWFYATRNS